MWYEMIPAAFLSGGLLAIPGIVIPHVNNYLLGTPMYRKLDGWYARHMYLRDLRIKNNNFYQHSCLEGIPDE